MPDDTSLLQVVHARIDALIQRFEDEKAHIAERSELLASNFNQWQADIERRLEAMNEMREQITRAEALFVPQSSYDAKHEDLSRRISILEQSQSKTQGGRDISVLWITTMLSVLGISVLLILKFIGR